MDTTNNRVGIGKAPTQGSLDVSNSIFSGNNITATGNLTGVNGVFSGNLQLSSSSTSASYIAKNFPIGSTGVTANNVVVLANESGSPKAIETTTARDPRVFGVAVATGASGSNNQIAISGAFQVNADTAAVVAGDQLVTSTTQGLVTVNNNATAGIVGYALSAKSAGSNGLINVLIVPTNGQSTPVFTTANFQIQSAAGTPLFTVDTATPLTSFRGAVNFDTIAGGSAAQIDGTTGYFRGAGLTNRANTGAYLTFGDVSGGISLLQRTSGAVVLTITGASGQTADLVQIENGSGNLVTAIDKDGKIKFADGSGGASDTNLYRSAAGIVQSDGLIRSSRASATDAALGTIVSGDTLSRYIVFADGKTEWGPGNASRDTNLYRSAADVLKTDDSFTIGTNLQVDGNTTLGNANTDSVTANANILGNGTATGTTATTSGTGTNTTTVTLTGSAFALPSGGR